MPNTPRFALRPLALLLGLALALPATASGASGMIARASSTSTPGIAQLIGQKLMVSMAGTTPSAALLGRVGRGEVGGVILFGSNIATAGALAAATRALRQAAAAGGQPPLLITTDQESDTVKRVPWAPPTLSTSQMAADGRTGIAFAQGRSTGQVLNCAGIDSDLAPVADVPASTSSFIYRQGRAWSFSAATTASLSDAFARGLVAGLDVPAMKHFPGLAFANQNTDTSVVTITASKAALAPGLEPYETAIGHGIPMIMLSNATYTAYDAGNAAGWSNAVSVGLLRDTLGFTGVTITDSLAGAAHARGVSAASLAIRAATAGTDMLLLGGSEASTGASYTSLLAAAQAGTIPLATLQASYDRIVALKSGLTPAAPDTTPPAVTHPTSRLYAPATLGAATTPVLTQWTARDPCAVSAESLARRAGEGSFATQVLPSPRANSIRQSLAFGKTYRYEARAADGAGNLSAWNLGTNLLPRISQQSGIGVTLGGGTWHTASIASASGGSVAYATGRGAWAAFHFTGASVSWVAALGPGRGSAAVYLDGTYKTTISLASASDRARRVVYAASWPSSGVHTLRIVNLGTAGHPRVDVDAFVRLAAS